jgi:hypothetical protein
MPGKLLHLTGAACSVILSQSLLLLYIGQGIAYGAFVGVESRSADLERLGRSARISLNAAIFLQVPLVLFIAGYLARSGQRSDIRFTRYLKSIGIAALLDVLAAATLLFLGRLGVGPIVSLLQFLDRAVFRM